MKEQPVVLITHVDSDAGYRRARELLAGGHRVVVTAGHASRLTRILLGQNADQVIAIAADLSDPQQRARLVQRTEERLGHITWIVDGLGRRQPSGLRDERVDVLCLRIEAAHPAHLTCGRVPVVEPEALTQPVGDTRRQAGEHSIRLRLLGERDTADAAIGDTRFHPRPQPRGHRIRVSSVA